MAETEETEITEEDAPKKSSKLPMIIGLVLALAGGGGGFFAVYSGMILGTGEAEETAVEESEEPMENLPDVAFVPVDPIVVSLNDSSSSKHLRFRAQLEVPSKHQADVEGILPRVVDVLNSYLRALEPTDIQGTAALIKLRAQMLRRIQVVTGQGRVRDLLIMEFVLN